jgi:Amt family ammonium transporter
LVATHVAASAAAIGWLLIETLHRGKPSTLGAASGIVAGLVAITPASGFVAPWAAMVIGLAAGIVCYLAVLQKARFGYDDSLDVFGVHGVGGMLGALLTGVFAEKWLNDAGNDGAIRGHWSQLGVQAVGVLASAAVAVVLTIVLWKLTELFTPMRVKPAAEDEGLDSALHGEEGYAN